MDKPKQGEALNALAIADAARQLVQDAYVVCGKLTEDRIERLAGALHSCYGISREEANEHVARFASLNRFKVR